MWRVLPERKRSKPQIIITNLIDVVLMMVFFFMITTSFAKSTRKLPVDLPTSSSAVVTANESLTVQLSADGKVAVGGQEVAADRLRAVVAEQIAARPDRAVVLEADVKLGYGQVMAVLEELRQAGAHNLGLSALPPKPEARRG